MNKSLWLLVLLCLDARADWKYQKVVDAMTSKTVTMASIESQNSLDLARPYQGKNLGSLTVMSEKTTGTAFMLTIDKGQIICDISDGCKILFRFDDAQPVSFHATKTTDHSSKDLIFRNGKRFIEAASKAKKIRAQITLYQAGSQILEFSSSESLIWKPQK